jgi:hypothetical protein
MLVESLLLLLVVVIAALMAVDVVRSRGESLHEHADGQAHGITYPVTGARRADRGEAFLRPPAATGIPVRQPATSGIPAAPTGMADASSAGRAASASISPPAGNDPRSHVASAGDPGLHGKLDAMFVNLSHRSQTLVERQIRLLQILEQGEKDPERQAILFRLDRIANRMRRNSENLLILAGQEPSDNWNQPVALANVIRVAVSEVEEGQRVSLNAHPDIAIVGSAVNDVVHLLAELIENATSFSAVQVDISAQLLTSGGALLDITDQGIGMTPKDLAYANWRLENPPSPEVTVPKWIGLFVVARLAARHGIGIRLQPAKVGGLTALVWLPNEVLTQPVAAAPPRFSDFGAAGTRRGLHEAEPPGPGYATVRHRAAAAQVAPPAGNGWKPQLDRRSVADPGQRSDAPWSPGARPALWAGPAADAASPGPESHDTMGEHAGVSGQPAQNSGGEPTGNIASGSVGAPLGSTGSDASQVATAPGHAAPASQQTSLGDGVIVPSAEGLAEKRALPIFNEVESLWFKDGRGTPTSPDASAAAGSRWSSPVDAGWRAAEVADSPSSAGSTAAGLPKRAPRANLLPGAISSTETVLPKRSAAAARERLAGLQRGTSEGRAAAKQAVSADEEEESSDAD